MTSPPFLKTWISVMSLATSSSACPRPTIVNKNRTGRKYITYFKRSFFILSPWLKADRHPHFAGDALAALDGRFEFPLFDGIDRRLFKSGIRGFLHPRICHFAAGINDEQNA